VPEPVSMSMLEAWPSIVAAIIGLRLFMSTGICATAASLHFEDAGGAALVSAGLTNIANSAARCRIRARRGYIGFMAAPCL
jgi:hypothetical protein